MINKVALIAVGFTVAATAVFAASHAGPFDGAINARKSHMRLYNHNGGILGGMAQGKIDYDAGAATAAAANLAALARMSQASYWPQGSDSAAISNTRALPAIWENFADVGAKAGALVAATAALETAAGGGLDSLKGAIGPVFGACGACHKVYRQPR